MDLNQLNGLHFGNFHLILDLNRRNFHLKTELITNLKKPDLRLGEPGATVWEFGHWVFIYTNRGIHTELKEVNLQGANLQGACLQKTILSAFPESNKEVMQKRFMGVESFDTFRSYAKNITIDVPYGKGSHWSPSSARHRQDADRAGSNGISVGSQTWPKTNLKNANLTDAELTGAELTGANLTDAELTGAKHLSQKQENSAKGRRGHSPACGLGATSALVVAEVGSAAIPAKTGGPALPQHWCK